MANHECNHEQDWGTQEELNSMLRAHIKDLPAREGRLVSIEHAIKSIRGWAIIAAFVGGLLGRAAPDAVNFIAKSAFAEDKINKAVDNVRAKARDF